MQTTSLTDTKNTPTLQRLADAIDRNFGWAWFGLFVIYAVFFCVLFCEPQPLFWRITDAALAVSAAWTAVIALHRARQ